jgi:hypothetical protein
MTFRLYLFIAVILKLLLASDYYSNGEWSKIGSEKLDDWEVAPLPYTYSNIVVGLLVTLKTK